jgi:hypothetical protein
VASGAIDDTNSRKAIGATTTSSGARWSSRRGHPHTDQGGYIYDNEHSRVRELNEEVRQPLLHVQGGDSYEWCIWLFTMECVIEFKLFTTRMEGLMSGVGRVGMRVRLVDMDMRRWAIFRLPHRGELEGRSGV